MNEQEIVKTLIDYVLANHPSGYNADTLPIDQSLVDLSIIDSYGIVEIVVFIEQKWGISIEDNEINRDNIGSIEKMSRFIMTKTGA